MAAGMKKLYFTGKYGDLFDSNDIAKVALITEGIILDVNNLDAVREYALHCLGINREIQRPSVKYLIKRGNIAKAVLLYRDMHPGVGLREANDIVYKMKEDLEKK